MNMEKSNGPNGDKTFWRSKKALSAVLGAVTLAVLAALKAPGEAYLAAGAIFGLHQASQGTQDAMRARAGAG
jgi:hypothetical protein